MDFTVAGEDGKDIAFECADTLESRWVCEEILLGRTYPFLPFVPDVRIVVDAGANCGAATVHLARHYPDADVHSVEPGSEPRAILERNVARYPNVQIHPIGLHAIDDVMPLYKGGADTILGSLHRRDINVDDSELVQIRSAGAWASEQGIRRIDVLKVDVEGCELDVLESLVELLPTVKVLYVEYDSRDARREVERLMAPTHELYAGVMFLDQGECIYLRKDLADLDAASAHLRHMLESGRTSHGR